MSFMYAAALTARAPACICLLLFLLLLLSCTACHLVNRSCECYLFCDGQFEQCYSDDDSNLSRALDCNSAKTCSEHDRVSMRFPSPFLK